MAVLVTGASGHVGANLVRALLARGARVRALVRRETSRRPFEGLDVALVEGDIRDPVAMEAAVRGAEVVYHCAAKVQTVRGHEQELYETNVLGTRNVLRAARASGVKRVVVTSSLGAVGQPRDRPCDETCGFNPFEHHLPYEESKAWVEHECLRFACEGLPVVMVVSTAVLGPYDFGPSRMGRVIKDFANRAMKAYIPGGFEFVGAGDLARGHLLAMEKGTPGQRYIVSSAFLSVDDLMTMLERITSVPRPRLRLSPALMMGIAHPTTFVLSRLAPDRPIRFTPDAVRLLTMQRRADISKARRELGYVPTSIEDAVADAYAWFVAQGDVPAPPEQIPRSQERGATSETFGRSGANDASR
jgi:nucleoside-diphosphate-sugar epimerase